MPEPALREIDVDELATRVGDGARGVRLFDVREPDEYVGGHVPGAASIPLAMVPEHLDELRAAAPVHVICQAGGRSRRACEYLVVHGIDAVNVDGGTGAWAASGRPLVAGDER